MVAFASGASGLGYEIVWTRALGLVLGHEATSALAVVCAFFAGLAAGGLLLGGAVARGGRPLLVLGALEAMIGAWALVLAVVLPRAGSALVIALGTDAGPAQVWAAAFGLTFVLLLPATLVMGGTLPALSRALRGAGEERDALPLAYALNTAGAVAGTLTCTLLLLPGLGFHGAQATLAALNAACALVCLIAARGQGAMPPPMMPGPAGTKRAAMLFATGLLAIGYEVLCIRVTAQVFENTVFTFAAVLSVFLVGTAGGSAVMSWPRARSAAGPPLLCALCGLLVAGGALALDRADEVLGGARAALGDGMAGAILAELLCAASILLLPSAAMGALFASLASGQGARLGAALAANLAGSALAPVLFGVVLLPLAGPSWTILIVAAGYLVLARPRTRTGQAARGVAVAGVAACALAAPRLDFIHAAGPVRVVAQRVGPTATVTVVEDGPGRTHLQINSHFRQGGSASLYSDAREALVPLLLHGSPRRALFLGLGTGATIGAARAVPGLVADGVELVPEVLGVLPRFTLPDGPLDGDSRIALHVADARRFVRASQARWDVIVADLYFPAVDGAGALYTREHYAAIAARLAPGGVFCQWLPLHQMDAATLRPILRAFLAAFPDGQAWLAHFGVDTPLLGLIGRASPAALEPGYVARAGAGYSDTLRRYGLASDVDLFALFVAGPAALQAFAGAAPINTDDRPIATWRAPAVAYAAREAPSARLLALLDALRGPTDGAIAGDAARWQALLRARDAFLRVGAGFDRALPADAAIAALAPRLLDVLRLSPEFAPAYDPLLGMAGALAGRDPEAARRLLIAARDAAPLRPEAPALLSRLGD